MIFAIFIIIMVILGTIGVPILDYLISCLETDKKRNSKTIYKNKTYTKSSKSIKNKEIKNNKLPGVHEDYDEKLKKELIKEGKYDDFNFEEEDLEEDDYHYEDD